MAENLERETAAGGESYRTRLAEIEAELGMLVSQFAQNPATDDECRDVEARFTGEDDSVVDDLPRLREELARLAANVNSTPKPSERKLPNGTRSCGAARRPGAARETLLQSIREIEQQTQVIFNERSTKSRHRSAGCTRGSSGGEARMWQTNPRTFPRPESRSPSRRPVRSRCAADALRRRARDDGRRPDPGPDRGQAVAVYLLDEVDAAMDDTNVGRFLHAVRELSADSQMVLVTHNKLTMELADVLYGVTMREPGVSSIVSAELTPAPEAAIA